MGWGSSFANAWAAASDGAKAVTAKASQTAQAAWEHTKQKAASAFQSAQDATEIAKEKIATSANSAYDTASSGVAAVRDTTVQAGQWTAQKSKETSAAVGQAFDKIADSFKPQPAGSPAKACPYAKANRPPPPRGDVLCKPPPPCFKEALVVKCGHSERKFKLIPPNTPTNREHDQVIQLVADKNGQDEIDIGFSAGSCPFGNGPDLPCLSFKGQRSKAALKLKLDGPPSPNMPSQSPDEPGLIPIVEFFRHFILNRDGEGFVTHNGTVDCCQGAPGQSFRVEVFPKKEWSGTISANVDIGASTAKLHSMKKAKLVIKGELTGSYGVRKVKVAPPSLEIGRHPAQRRLPPSEMGFKSAKWFLDKVYPAISKFKESRYVKLEPEWPNLAFGGMTSLTEVKGRYNVAQKGEVSLSLSPLFGLKGTFDALQWLIDVACYAYLQPPPFAKLVSDRILEIRKQAEAGVGDEAIGFKAVARLDISAKGAIGGALKWEFLPEAKDKASGTLKVDLDITVSGQISGEFRVWKVSYAAGATISGESGVGGEVSACVYGDDPFISGKVIFKGLKIKGMVYQTFGGSSVGTKDEGQAPVASRKSAKKNPKKQKKSKSSWWDPFSANTDDARMADEADWEMIILEEASWPSADEGDSGGGQFGGGDSGGSGASARFTPLAAAV